VGDSVRIDPAAIEEIKNRLSVSGKDLPAIGEELAAKMEGLSEAYGSDDTGGLIMAIHQEILEAFQGCLEDAGADIEGVALTLGDVGASTQELDEVIAASFNDLQNPMG
jgi:hypothetical protein